MRAVSYEMAAELGIDTSMIKACTQIRKLAKLDRIKLDDSEHRSGLNKHLFRYIEYCGLDTLEFIKQYLSNLQPYMIEQKKELTELLTEKYKVTSITGIDAILDRVTTNLALNDTTDYSEDIEVLESNHIHKMLENSGN